MDMPPEEGRRKKHPVRYEILLVPQGEGGKKRSFYASKGRLWTYGLLTFVLVSTIIVLMLVYTPVAMYIPIKNPELEQRYGRQILETQHRLSELAQDVLVLRDYNQQLRKALGEFEDKDSSAGNGVASRVPERHIEQPGPDDSAFAFADAGVALTVGSAQGYGDYDLIGGSFSTVLTSREGFRGAFPLLAPIEGFLTQGFDPT
ncbi:MAG: hypothetical protein AAB393_07590, partial [Bacteroidota bacterium]